MAAVKTKVYALSTGYLHGTPHQDHEVATKGEAEELEASGAFTTDPRHPDRLRSDPEPTPAAPAEST